MNIRGKHFLVLSFLLPIAACGAYFGPQAVFYLRVRQLAMPVWWSRAPVALMDTTASSAPGTELSYFGYKFEVPWVGVVNEAEEGRWAKVRFAGGQEVAFANPQLSQTDPLLEHAEQDPSVSQTVLRPIHAGSRYEHLEAVLTMTPSKIAPFLSRRDFNRSRAYLEAKGTYLEHSGATDIYHIESGSWKGFEVSGIEYNGRATIVLFDSADREFNISISGGNDPRARLTQADVNRVIQSFGVTTSKPVGVRQQQP